MKKIGKKITVIILAAFMLLTYVPDFVSIVEADSTPLDRIEAIWDESDYEDVKLVDGYINYYGNGSLVNVSEFFTRQYSDFTFTLSNNGVLSSTPSVDDACTVLSLGETYYIRVNYEAATGKIFTQDTKVKTDSNVELDSTYPYYYSDLVIDDETHAHITFQFKCAEIFAAYSEIKAPQIKPSSKPSDFTTSSYTASYYLFEHSSAQDSVQDGVTCSIDEVVYYDVETGLPLNPNATFGSKEYCMELKLNASSFEDVITDYDISKCYFVFYYTDEDTSYIQSTNNSNNTKRMYPFSGFDSLNEGGIVSVTYYVGSFTELNNVKVNEYNSEEKILNITLEGANLPSELSVSAFVGEYPTINDVQNIDDEFDLCCIMYSLFYMDGVCIEYDDEYTQGTLELECGSNSNINLTGDETITLYIESGNEHDAKKLVKVFSLKEPEPVHTTKKYTAKNVNTSAEKISGSSSKGSKRTVTPKEGKKVGSVKVTDSKGNIIPVTLNADGTYSFTQPASSVNVEVTYVNREITLNIGSTEASVDGDRTNLDVCPVIRNDRTMLPIRFVAENLGAKVEWDETSPNYVLITKGDIKIEITLGSDVMKVNGKEVKLDVVAFAENDRTYLPVRAVSENLNAVVEWNEAKPMEVKIYER